MRKSIVTFTLCLFVFTSAKAFDQKKVEIHLKKALNLSEKIKLEVGPAFPTEFAGLFGSTVTIEGNKYPIYINKEETHYFWGNLFDLRVDPDVMRFSKINFKDIHSQGDAKAKVTVVEYTDMQCPYCQKVHQELKKSLYKDYKTTDVRFVFKHFPLGSHDWAQSAAEATECAATINPSTFFPLSDLYFENGETIKKDTFKENTDKFLTQLKIDKVKFAKCLENPAIAAKVKAEKEEGLGIGVQGTPSFFVNGRMLRGSGYEDLKALIDEKLKETN